MERKDTEALLKLTVSQKEHNPNLSESIVTEMSDRDENLFDSDAFNDFREAILAEPRLRYEVDLDNLTNNQMIYVASVDVNQIAEDENRLLKDQQESQKKNIEAVQKRNETIKSLESQAKARLLSQYLDRTKKLKINDKTEKKDFKSRITGISKRYKEAKTHLSEIVSSKKQYAKLHIGKLKEKQDLEIIAMSKTEKKLYIRIEMCRAVKDKLPCAHYVMLVSL